MVKSTSLKSDVLCRNGKSIHLVVLYPVHISERLLLLYVSDFVSCQDNAFIIIICQFLRIFWIKLCVTTYICYLFRVFCACKYFCHLCRNSESIAFCVRLPRCGNMQKHTFVTLEQHACFRCFAHFRSVCC